MFICIRKADTDQGSVDKGFSKYCQPVPSTLVTGVITKPEHLWFHYQTSRSMTDNGVTSSFY